MVRFLPLNVGASCHGTFWTVAEPGKLPDHLGSQRPFWGVRPTLGGLKFPLLPWSVISAKVKRFLTALPRTGLLAGISQPAFPDGRIEATQIGLVWRLARRSAAFQPGVTEAEFQDVGPMARTCKRTHQDKPPRRPA